MQVLLLATDEQPKLPHLSAHIAGPMLPVANRPVITVPIEILARAGVKNILVSLCNRGSSIASYVGDGRRWGVKVEYIIQRQGWGTAGALKWAGRLLNETVLVLPADAIVDLDIDAALAAHRDTQSLATAVVHRSPRGQHPHQLYANAGGLLAEAPNNASQVGYAVGAFLLEPQLLQYIPAQTQFDSLHQFLPSLTAAGVDVRCYEMSGYWNPLDTFEEYQEAQKTWLHSAYAIARGQPLPEGVASVRYPSIEGNQIAPGIWVGHTHAIHPGARLAAPVCIGEGCQIGREVELGPDVVIGSNVIIDDEATVQHSTVLENTYIGQLVNIAGRVVSKTTIIDAQTAETIEVVDPFLLSETASTARSSRTSRAISALAAGGLIVLCLPLLLLLALLAALSSGGSVLVRTSRIGRRAASDTAAPQTFELFGFATRHADGATTAAGRWMQRWELDRLPELFNVVRGDLALVGVKPLRPQEGLQLHEEWQRKRDERPAGFTGLWYVQPADLSDIDAVLVADAYYAATHSWREDVRLLLRTPGAWLRRSSARGRSSREASKYRRQIDTVGHS